MEAFKNEDVEFTIQQKPHCLVEFEVKASTALTKKAQKEAIKAIAKDVSIPGFRKGKAPDEMILKRYPKAVDEKWQKTIADFAFKQCEAKAQIPVLNGDSPVQFKMKKCSVEDGAEMHFSFEREPEIPELTFEDLTLENIDRPQITSEKIDETIRQIRFFFAKWTRISERPIQEGDFVLLDVDIIDADPIKRLFSDTRFEVTDKSMAKWMKDLVLGMNTGDIKEGMSDPDEDAPEKDKEELKSRKVRVTIKTVETPTLPELDDAFAQKIGAENINDLKEKVEKLLNKQADDAVRQAKRDQISDLLLKKFSIEIPYSMIDRETKFRFRQLLQDPSFQTRFKSMSDEELKEFQEKIKHQSEEAIRLFYLCRKIVADAHIKVSAKELEMPKQSILDMMFDKNYLGDLNKLSEDKKALALSRLMLNKAHDYVIEKIENA